MLSVYALSVYVLSEYVLSMHVLYEYVLSVCVSFVYVMSVHVLSVHMLSVHETRVVFSDPCSSDWTVSILPVNYFKGDKHVDSKLPVFISLFLVPLPIFLFLVSSSHFHIPCF